MTKMLTFRNLMCMFLFLLGAQSSYGQAAFWSETFGSQAAFNAWTAASTGQGAQVWNRSTNAADPMGFGPTAPAAFVSPTVANGFAYYNSDANGDGNTHDVTLTSGPISCASHTSVGLRFHSQFADFQGSTAQVRVSTNGGNTWTAYDIFDDQPSYGVGQGALVPADIVTDIPLPVANSQAQVWLQFRWEGFWEYGWKLDDIELYDYAAPNVNVTFRVNMALQTIDPGGARIAGSFNNWTDELMTNQGNGVWSITKSLAANTAYQYKFKNGPNGWEQAPPACGVDDGFGGFNRGITPSADVTLPAVCFSSCDACVLPCNLNPDAIICDNFDTYNPAQKLGPQAVHWTTWDGVEGTSEDGIVTTEQASSAPNALKVVSTAATGGPQDVVLNLSNKTTGHYGLKWKIYVPAGKHAYYNIQDVIPIPASPVTENWNLDVFFEDGGTGRVAIELVDQATFSYTNGAWIAVEHDIDLDNNILTLKIDGHYAGQYPYPDNLGGIDFYGVDNVSTFYIDDVEYVSLPPVVYNVDICDAAVNLTSYLGGTAGVAQTTGLYDNTNANVEASDPDVTCWGETSGADIVDGSLWYTFIGDGGMYHFETVPCNATNYIGDAQQDPGDTQMLIYAGDNCNDLTEVACNDDLYPTGVPDWRSAIDIQTEAGQNYYMLIDGFNFSGTVALGQFCIEIKQVASVTCADGAVGTYEIPNPYLCFEGQLANLITLDEASFVLPNEGPVAGMAWAISSAPVAAGTWPSDAAGYLGSTGFLDAPFAVGYTNVGPDANPPGFNYGIYYATPVVLGGGTVIDPTVGVSIGNVDPSAGCFFTGASTQIFFLPLLDDITATAVAGSGSVNLTPGGGLGALLGDESLYLYNWSNGATTQDLSGVPVGTYTCVVSDVSGCALEAIVTVQVTTVGTNDPASVQAFTVSPNPTSGTVTVNLALAAASDVRIEVVNTLGQTLQNLNVGKVMSLNQPVELGNLAQGSYFLRVTVDGETAIRRVVLQR